MVPVMRLYKSKEEMESLIIFPAIKNDINKLSSSDYKLLLYYKLQEKEKNNLINKGCFLRVLFMDNKMQRWYFPPQDFQLYTSGFSFTSLFSTGFG